jgi:2-hydroxychromene-2-carboxylate isomerase/rhodanese-related sulfurtransferase
MTHSVDFYFDFSSPYSYIASHVIAPLVEPYGVELAWKPFLLGVMFKTTGAGLLTVGHEWKTSYALQDFTRSAEFYGLPYQHPSRFPQSSAMAGRCALWIGQTYGHKKIAAFSQAVFKLLFVQDGDINDLEALSLIASSLGLDAAPMLAAIQTPQVKQLLATATEQAAASKVFGAPTVVFEGERFWGVDRLPQLEYRIKKTLGGKSVQALLGQAMSAVKTLDLDQAKALQAQGDAVFVDIRDPRELEREGVIPGAFHAPRGLVEFWIDPKSPYYKPIFTADKQFVFFCAAGWRSALTTLTVQNMGFLPNIAHIEGGFEAWKKSGAPVQEYSKKPSTT